MPGPGSRSRGSRRAGFPPPTPRGSRCSPSVRGTARRPSGPGAARLAALAALAARDAWRFRRCGCRRCTTRRRGARRRAAVRVGDRDGGLAGGGGPGPARRPATGAGAVGGAAPRLARPRDPDRAGHRPALHPRRRGRRPARRPRARRHPPRRRRPRPPGRPLDLAHGRDGARRPRPGRGGPRHARTAPAPGTARSRSSSRRPPPSRVPQAGRARPCPTSSPAAPDGSPAWRAAICGGCRRASRTTTTRSSSPDSRRGSPS